MSEEFVSPAMFYLAGPGWRALCIIAGCWWWAGGGRWGGRWGGRASPRCTAHCFLRKQAQMLSQDLYDFMSCEGRGGAGRGRGRGSGGAGPSLTCQGVTARSAHWALVTGLTWCGGQQSSSRQQLTVSTDEPSWDHCDCRLLRRAARTSPHQPGLASPAAAWRAAAWFGLVRRGHITS